MLCYGMYCILFYSILLYCLVLYCSVLYCIVLYCVVLYSIVLYSIVLYCIVLYCIVLYCIVLCCIVFFCIAFYCIVLYCIVLYCVVLCGIVLYCVVLYCIALYCVVLYCIVLCCIVLYCIVLYCIVLCCVVLCCVVLYCIVLYCIVLCGIVFYCIVLYVCIILFVYLLLTFFSNSKGSEDAEWPALLLGTAVGAQSGQSGGGLSWCQHRRLLRARRQHSTVDNLYFKKLEDGPTSWKQFEMKVLLRPLLSTRLFPKRPFQKDNPAEDLVRWSLGLPTTDPTYPVTCSNHLKFLGKARVLKVSKNRKLKHSNPDTRNPKRWNLKSLKLKSKSLCIASVLVHPQVTSIWYCLGRVFGCGRHWSWHLITLITGKVGICLGCCQTSPVDSSMRDFSLSIFAGLTSEDAGDGKGAEGVEPTRVADLGHISRNILGGGYNFNRIC